MLLLLLLFKWGRLQWWVSSESIVLFLFILDGMWGESVVVGQSFSMGMNLKYGICCMYIKFRSFCDIDEAVLSIAFSFFVSYFFLPFL